MNMKKEESFFEGFLLGAIFGAVVSTIAALLFAPKSGKEFRKDISEGTARTLESTDEYLELAREKGTKVIHDVEDAALAYFNLATGKAEEVVEDTADKAEEIVEDTTDKVEEVVEDTKAEAEKVEEVVEEKIEEIEE